MMVRQREHSPDRSFVEGKPSVTARKVALNVVALGGRPGMGEVLPPGIVDATAELLLKSGVAGPTTLALARAPSLLALYDAFDFLMPGQFEAFAHRKAFCERQAREGIAAGATQVLVLGAGYDTLGQRLAPELPNVAFLEIDHPATSRVKARGIERIGRPSNLHLIAADLSERSLTDVLTSCKRWNPGAPSVIVAEGLLMYLPPPAPSQLFERCASVTGTGSRIAFTYVETGNDGRPDAGPWTNLVLWSLKTSGEPWLWSVRPAELPGFLDPTGWTLAPELIGDRHRYGIEHFGVAVR